MISLQISCSLRQGNWYVQFITDKLVWSLDTEVRSEGRLNLETRFSAFDVSCQPLDLRSILQSAGGTPVRIVPAVVVVPENITLYVASAAWLAWKLLSWWELCRSDPSSGAMYHSPCLLARSYVWRGEVCVLD